MSKIKGSEIKGIDQIFPQKTDHTSAAGNIKLWAVAGLVATLAAGYAFLPTRTPSVQHPAVNQPSVAQPVASRASVTAPVATPAEARIAKSTVETVVKKLDPAQVVVNDVKITRKHEAQRQQQQQRTEVSQSSAREVKAASKALGGRSCDCDTAELNLPAQCPAASCRQCKATCGIPGN